MYRLDLSRVRPRILPVFAHPARLSDQGVRAVLQTARRKSTVPVSVHDTIATMSSPFLISVFCVIRSSYSWNNVPYDIPDMYSKPGTPCNDYNGYCDVFQRCREVSVCSRSRIFVPKALEGGGTNFVFCSTISRERSYMAN